MIVHYGQTIHAGHYVTFAKVGSKWLLLDDAKVHIIVLLLLLSFYLLLLMLLLQMTEVNPAVVLQQSAYMLFYRRVTDDRRKGSIHSPSLFLCVPHIYSSSPSRRFDSSQNTHHYNINNSEKEKGSCSSSSLSLFSSLQ